MDKAFRGDRLHIAIFGRCNTGKSSVLNCIAGQEVAIVSDEPGTTGDPVALGFELLPLGPVTFYDTAGLDENSELGILRQKAGRKVLARSDLAILVTDEAGIGPWEKEIIESLQKLETPFLVLFNKADLWESSATGNAAKEGMFWCGERRIPAYPFSARNEDPARLRNTLAGLAPKTAEKSPLLIDILQPGEHVILITPLDGSAPVGRLIVPQVQCIRELVEFGHPTFVMQPEELPTGLELLNTPPALVVTDSQTVKQVAASLSGKPGSVPLTTFSIVFARQKGDFSLLLEGARAIGKLRPQSKILIAEACSHHAQSDDIARVKIPALLNKYTGHTLDFTFSAGRDFPDDLGSYDLVIHCGACMLNPGEMKRRLRLCSAAGVPATNFGMTISAVQGLLERVVAPFLQVEKQ